MVLEEAPVIEARASDIDRPAHILTLSAKCQKSLKDLTIRFVDYLAGNPSTPMADVGYTANTGRSHFSYRLALVAESSTQAHEKLASYLEGKTAVRCAEWRWVK